MKNSTKKIVGGLALVATLGGCVTTSPSKGVAPTLVDDINKIVYNINFQGNSYDVPFQSVLNELNLNFNPTDLGQNFEISGKGIYTKNEPGSFQELIRITDSDVNYDNSLEKEEVIKSALSVLGLGTKVPGRITNYELVDFVRQNKVSVKISYDGKTINSGVILPLNQEKGLAKLVGDFGTNKPDSWIQKSYLDSISTKVQIDGGGSGGGGAGGGAGGGGGSGSGGAKNRFGTSEYASNFNKINLQ